MEREFRLEQSEGRLQLVHPDGKEKPIWIDFTGGGRTIRTLRRRFRRSDPLFKAIGAQSKMVWDLTAGLGEDALALALMGYQVEAVERSALLYPLLKDGVERASQQDAQLAQLFIDQLHFHWADSRDFLERQDASPDAIYLDPMFPPARKSALPRKEMRWLRELLGEQEQGLAEADELLRLSLRRSPRVVVKRPRKGPVLLGLEPTHRFLGQSVRFDLYITGLRPTRA